MAERPPSDDFHFEFDASDDEGVAASSGSAPEQPAEERRGRRGRSGDGAEAGDGPSKAPARRRRPREEEDSGPPTTFDPTLPSSKERPSRSKKMGIGRKPGAAGASSRAARTSRSSKEDRPDLIRAEEGRERREGRSRKDSELDAFDAAFEAKQQHPEEGSVSPQHREPPPDLGFGEADLDFQPPAREPGRDEAPDLPSEPEPGAPERSRAPSLADDDLFDSAFEGPGDAAQRPRDINTAPSARRRRRDDGDEGRSPGRAGDLVRAPDTDGRGDATEPVRRRSVSASAQPGAQRSVGGYTLPGFEIVSTKLRELSERLGVISPQGTRDPDRPGAVTPGVSGGGLLGGGGLNLPFKLPFGWGDGGNKKGQIKKVRVLIILAGLSLLALVSTFFGMMMAVSSDLPNLENRAEFNEARNSIVYDAYDNKIGTLTNNNNRILVDSSQISPGMKQATVSIEDRRFYEHSGVDIKGMARAAFADLVPGGSTQGASTITQQFVKNALEAQADRTVLEKFREAALAYHLEKQWDKDKILTQYLNTIYFGEGAYGVEAAARTYFGYNHEGCGTPEHLNCAQLLLPEESAMLAGIISSPSAFSPIANPQAALGRRNLVLDDEVKSGYMTEDEAAIAKTKPLPSESDIERPEESSEAPYFTSWLRQVLVDRYGPGRAFGGGLKVKTTLDLDLQHAAEDIVRNTLGGVLPTSSIVVIDNKTGGIRAMVGGLDYKETPFNLATNGHRQPGSSFKPFTLITALEHGQTAGTTYNSAQVNLRIPFSGKSGEMFNVNNYDDIYYGPSSIETCTIHSDNSCFAQMGYHIDSGPGKEPSSKSIQKSLDDIVQTAHKMGIETDITQRSDGLRRANPALILGGLATGVTPLEMAHAYSTLANDGQRVSGTLASSPGGPVPMLKIMDGETGKTIKGGDDKVTHKRVIPERIATTAKSILSEVVAYGTGKRAQVGEPQWGKTGTTDDNGDAWFCGAISAVTACVWVGDRDKVTPMETEFGGQPVDGGTFPAIIWAQVINAYTRIQAEHDAGIDNNDGGESGATSSGYTAPSYSAPSTSTPAPSTGGGGGGGGNTPTPNPTPAPAPSGGGGGGGGSGGIGSGL